MKLPVAAALCLLCLSSCKFEAKLTTGSELKGEGITFLVPTESSSASQGTGGIQYEGDSVKASTDGKSLTVNSKSYGAVKAGDIVNLREKGKVLVNGAERTPAAP